MNTEGSIKKYKVCSECGAWCCKGFDYVNWYVRYSLRDIVRICGKYNISIEKFLEKYVHLIDQGTYSIPVIKAIDGKCPFLRGTTCTIHDVKPIACRVFPVRPPGQSYDERCPLSRYPELLVEEEQLIPIYVREHIETEVLLCEKRVKSIRDLYEVIRSLMLGTF